MMDLSGYSILLVEDSSDDILLIRRAFRQANVGNPIRIVQNGDDAVAYLAGMGDYCDRSQYPLPALILLDLKLPRRHGLEVLEWLQQQPGLRRIPVLVLTSSQENQDVDRAYDLGANSYLIKPVRFEDLNKMVQVLESYWLQLNQFPSSLSTA